VTAGFETKPSETVAAGFEPKQLETIATGFEPNQLETIAAGFEVKPTKTVRVVLRPNHSQTVNLGFDAQPRNSRSSPLCAWCRPHTSSPDLSIAGPLSTQPVRPFTVLCTRSPTPVMISITARHAAPATCTPRDKQTRFSKRNKDKS
jgi:hypothetical protein